MMLCIVPYSPFNNALGETPMGSEDSTVESEPLVSFFNGTLADHQDSDSFTTDSTSQSVHKISILNSTSDLYIEVSGAEGKVAEIIGSTGTFLHFSGEFNAVTIDITSANFSGPNSYQLLVHTYPDDNSIQVKPDFSTLNAQYTVSGYIHSSDTTGDFIIFEVGGNAPLKLTWESIGDVNFTGHMSLLSAQQTTTFDIPNGSGEIALNTPETAMGQDEWEIIVNAKANGTGWWSVAIEATDTPDEKCTFDCSSITDLLAINEAFELENDVTWQASGHLSEIDGVDVYPIHIPGESWETHRLIATMTPSESGMEVQIQCWNNSGEFISVKEIVSGTNVVGLNMTPGYHFVIVRHGSSASGGEYQLNLNLINSTSPEDEPIDPSEFEDLWKKFLPFYILVGVLLLSPLAWVLWSMRGVNLREEIQTHERARLRHLHERLRKLLASDTTDDVAISDALEMLSAIQWRATESEMGESILTHHTEAVTLKVWNIEGKSILVGIHIEEASWELAAIRFEAISGPEWKVLEVHPKSLFDGDEIFLGTLEAGSTSFIHLTLEGVAEGLDIHLSGLLKGNPIAAIPAKALLLLGEEE
jgi:hypothetical protein